ncbi:MAG: hypothetical protein KAR20_00930, partial [Candidatus Heimdallarchaeota archaeon]|nr:hypothetical protein [Candidatus Heimdallarchaeota archaeon]
YYWKIRARDSYGLETDGPTWYFITKPNLPPYPPHSPIPENDSTNVYIDASLSWTGGDPEGDNVTYDLYFGSENPPPLLENNLSETTYEPAEMNTITDYYWRVVAWDVNDHRSSSPIWTFKTSTYTNSPPEKPSRPSGTSIGRPGVSYSYSTSTTDSNGEPIFYMVDWDDGSLSQWIGPYNSGQTAFFSHIWESRGSFAVKVKAKDIYGGESFWSDPLPVSMPKTYSTHLISFLEKLLVYYPFLHQVLFQ